MILLLPPSEGKSEPKVSENNLDLSVLPFPELSADRQRMMRSLLKLSNGSAKRAREVLGLSLTQGTEIERNQLLESAPVARAADIYSGVLFAALGLPSLNATTFRRADKQVLIMSSLFGAVRPSSEICAYRLSGSTSMPRLGRVSSYWKARLAKPLSEECATGIVIDLRSGTYEAFWPIPAAATDRAMAVKVWQQSAEGARTAVTHFSKHTKGLVARTLIDERRPPGTLTEVVDCLRGNGWMCDLVTTPTGTARLDVTIRP